MVRLLFDQGTLILDEVKDPSLVPPGFVFDNRIDRWRAPAFRYRTVIEALKGRGIRFEDRARRFPTLSLESAIRFVPHPYQEEALHAWTAHDLRGVIELPTGAGKSFLGQMAIERAKTSALVVVPTLDLLNQWYDLLSASFGEEKVGLIGGGYFEVNHLTATTYDSAVRHMDRLGDRFGLLIFDECHHLPGPVYAHAAEMGLAPFRLGLTATFERPDGRHALLEDLIGPLVYRKGIKELAGTYLADYEVRRVVVSLTPEERKAYSEARRELSRFLEEHRLGLGSLKGWELFVIKSSQTREGRRAMLAYQTSKRLALATAAKLRALEALLQQHPKDRVLIFTADCETVYTISSSFLLPAITHLTDIKERKAILEAFNRGEYPALVTSKVLNEGVNIPDANVGIVLSGSGSVREHVQRLGRILRKQGGKQAILYEVVTRGTVEERISSRRTAHDAYR